MSEFVVSVNDKKFAIRFTGKDCVIVNDKKYCVCLSKISDNSYLFHLGNKVFEITSNRIDSNRFGLMIDGWYYDTIVRTKLQESVNELQQIKSKAKHHSDVKAPMPGLILKIKKNIGDDVIIGEPILLLEAMKMENELRSPSSGRVKEIFFKEGQSVENGSIILTIE
jgi:acetyl/propionyl-CoA carboxylase alpha subunit